MSDLISKQKAINVFEILADKMTDDGRTVMAQAISVLRDLPSAEPERKAKVYHKQAPDRLYYFYCGACGEMIDCSFHEDYKSIKSYCGYCGAKLNWSE